jgi:uncharacterized protein (DUF4415 family)
VKRERITRAKLIDGTVYKIMADGSLRPMKDRTDWKRVNAMTDEEIEAATASDPDAAPVLDEAWIARARRAHPNKEQISIKLDRDVLAFFRKGGPRYQTRINDVLRAFMEHETAPSRRRAAAEEEAASFRHRPSKRKSSPSRGKARG